MKKLKSETKLMIAAVLIPALVTLLALAPFPQGIKIIGDLVFQERASVATTPVAGTGIFYVKNTTPSTAIFVDDTGSETTLGAGGGSGITQLTGDVTAGPGSGSQAATIAAGAVDIAMLSATGTPSASTYFRGDNTWATPAGGGDVVGPASSTDNAVARYDAETGKLLQNSPVAIEDDADVTGVKDISLSGVVDGRDVATDGTKLDGIESGATADQSDAEIETAYNNQVSVVDQSTAETGTSTTVYRWTPQRVGQAIAALGGSGGDPTYGSDAGASDDAVYVDADDQVGIGTTTPTEEIDIYQTQSAPRLKLTYYNEGLDDDVTEFAGLGADSGAVGTITWTGVTNIYADDSSAAVNSPLSDDATTHYLVATTFGIDIPTGAAVVGISFDVNGVYFEDDTPHTCDDLYIRVVKGGTVQTTVNRASGTTWPDSTPTTRTYGAANDLWGLTWTEADVEANDFGLAIAFTLDDNDEIQIDYITATVYYSTGVAGDRTWTFGDDVSDGAFTIRAGATDQVRIAYGSGDTEFAGDVTADAFIGDGSGLTGVTSTPGDGTVTNAKLANMAEATMKGRAAGAGTGVPGDLTASQIRTLINVADGATANAGTVTSVAVSGSDGVDVDSGSPVTGSGTIALGLNAATVYAHLLSTASTVTAVAGDSFLIADASDGGALKDALLSDLMLAIASTDNRLGKFAGTAGQWEVTGITVDDSNNVSGVGTLNGHTIPGGTATYVVTTGTQVLSGKLINPVEATDNSSPYAIGDVSTTARMCTITHSSGPATVSAPTGSPANGVMIKYMIDNVGMAADSITWDAVFVSGEEWELSGEIPEISGTSGTWTTAVFEWNAGESEWTLLAFSTGN